MLSYAGFAVINGLFRPVGQFGPRKSLSLRQTASRVKSPLLSTTAMETAELFPGAQTGALVEHVIIIGFDGIQYSLVEDGSRADRQLPFALQQLHARPGLFVQHPGPFDLEFHEQAPGVCHPASSDVCFADAV